MIKVKHFKQSENNKVVITREQIRQVTEEACKACNMKDGFFEQLWDAFLKNDDIYKEYVMYLVKKDFLILKYNSNFLILIVYKTD